MYFRTVLTVLVQVIGVGHDDRVPVRFAVCLLPHQLVLSTVRAPAVRANTPDRDDLAPHIITTSILGEDPQHGRAIGSTPTGTPTSDRSGLP